MDLFDAASKTDVDDAALLHRACGGDETAFEVLYRRHHDAIFRLCFRRVGDRLAAEELTQDVFVKAFGNLKSLQQGVSLLPWLVTVARNLCIDHLRTTANRSREIDIGQVDHLTGGASDPTGDGATDLVSARRIWQQVYPMLRELEVRDRELLWLRDVEGRSYNELTLTEGETKHALRNRAFRARTLVRERFIALREEGQTLGLLPIPGIAVGARIIRRLRELLKRHTQRSLEEWTVSMISVCGCFALAFGLILTHPFVEPDHVDSRRTVETTALSQRAKSALRTSGSHVVPTSDDGHRRDLSVSAGGIRAEVDTHKRSRAVAPDSVGFGVEVRSPNGDVLFWFHSGTRCVGGESDVLPATGVVYVYC